VPPPRCTTYLQILHGCLGVCAATERHKPDRLRRKTQYTRVTNRDNRAYKLSYLYIRKFFFYRSPVALLSTYIAKSVIYKNIPKLHTAQFSGDFDVLLGVRGKTKQFRSTKSRTVLNFLFDSGSCSILKHWSVDPVSTKSYHSTVPVCPLCARNRKHLHDSREH